MSRIAPRIAPLPVMLRPARLLPALLCAALLPTVFAPAVARAQSPVAGKWTANFELGMRNENGVVTSTGTGTARITLEARGDSVFGTWQVLDPAPPAGAATRPLRGVFANGVLRLETEPSTRRIVMNDAEHQIRMVTRYELTLSGDALTGTTRQVALGGEMEPPAREFKAVREK